MFGNTKINNPIYYPLLASEEINGGRRSRAETQEIWAAFDRLSEDKKNILTADEIPYKMKELQEGLKCDDASIEGISVLVRWFFFGQSDMESLQGGLQDVVGEKAPEALRYIQKEILELRPKPKVEEEKEEVEEGKRPQAVTVRLPLLQALSKYESLGNQLITRERIRVKSQVEPVRPSLLYWIKYYRDELGIGHHDSVQRGNFLFRSENGKRLSAEERERVNLVLKSVEENLPLQIDTERSEIVFPFFETPKPVAPRVEFPTPPQAPQQRESRETASTAFSFGRGLSFNNVEPAAADPGALSFSSKHVFPAEKSEAVPVPPVAPAYAQTPPPPPSPVSQVTVPENRITAPLPKANPFHIRPVSLGKKDE